MASRPVGECHVRQERTIDGRDLLYIDRADPVIRVSGELLREIAEHPDNPWATIDGDLVRVAATNRTVIYRLRDYDERGDIYIGEWPD